MNRPAVASAVLLSVAVATLAACGVRGGLEPAPPMWGEARAKYETDRAARAAEAAKKAEAEKRTAGEAAAPPPAPQPADPPPPRP